MPATGFYYVYGFEITSEDIKKLRILSIKALKIDKKFHNRTDQSSGQ